MENNNNLENNFEEKYNPFKDGSFWTASIIGLFLSAQSIWFTILSGKIQPTLIVGVVLIFSWTGWIIYKKGKKKSLIVGFIIALILAGLSFIPVMKMEERNRKARFEKGIEKYREGLKAKREKILQQSKE